MDILIVDDNLDAAESLAEILEPEGHSVTMGFDGMQAVDLYRETPFELVFMDLKMPVLDGMGAIRQIMEMDENARIVVVTGNTVKEDLEEALSLGIKGMLRKPINIREMFHLLNNLAGPGVMGN